MHSTALKISTVKCLAILFETYPVCKSVVWCLQLFPVFAFPLLKLLNNKYTLAILSTDGNAGVNPLSA
jgi:hypothetical protein